MKWFKHETDAICSEKIARLISEFGFEGYGRFWRIMEVVAERMDKSDRCHVELPEKEWLRLLSIRRPLFDRYLATISSLFDNWRITTDTQTQLIRIEISNLLKKRDNYTTNLQPTNKKLANRSRSRKEVEEEKDMSPQTQVDPPLIKPKDSSREPSDTVKAEMAWIAEYENQIGEIPNMSPAKDRTILKTLIKTHGLDKVLAKIAIHISGKKLLSIGGFQTLYNDLGLVQIKKFETWEEKNERERKELRRKYAGHV
jgi:hypothetical protein